MSTAQCYLAPIRNRPNLASRPARLQTACCSTVAAVSACSILSAVCAGQARAGREVVVSGGSINLRNCWNSPASASPSGSRPRHHAATPCPASARTCATTTRRARAGRSAPRASPSTTRSRGLGLVWQALRYAFTGKGLFRHGGRAAALYFARRARGAGSAARLGADVHEPGPRGPRIAHQSGMTCYAHVMRPESQHPYRLG